MVARVGRDEQEAIYRGWAGQSTEQQIERHLGQVPPRLGLNHKLERVAKPQRGFLGRPLLADVLCLLAGHLFDDSLMWNDTGGCNTLLFFEHLVRWRTKEHS